MKLTLELRSAGLSRNAIPATRHMSKNFVGDIIHIVDKRGITFEDVRQLDEDAFGGYEKAPGHGFATEYTFRQIVSTFAR